MAMSILRSVKVEISCDMISHIMYNHTGNCPSQKTFFCQHLSAEDIVQSACHVALRPDYPVIAPRLGYTYNLRKKCNHIIGWNEIDGHDLRRPCRHIDGIVQCISITNL